MKKHLIIFGMTLMFIVSCITVCGQGDEWSKWESPEPDWTIVYFLVFVMIIIFVMIFLLVIYLSSKAKEEYQDAMDRLDTQLENGKISEETYKELKKDLEIKHQKAMKNLR